MCFVKYWHHREKFDGDHSQIAAQVLQFVEVFLVKRLSTFIEVFFYLADLQLRAIFSLMFSNL